MGNNHAELRALAEKATKGPWTMTDGKTLAGVRDDGKVQLVAAVFGIVEYGDNRDKERSQANVEFLMASNPSAVLELLAEIEALRGALKEETDIRHCKGLRCTDKECSYFGSPVRVAACACASEKLRAHNANVCKLLEST